MATFGLFTAQRMLRCALVCSLLASVGAPILGAAQVELTPFVGLYAPTTHLPGVPGVCLETALASNCQSSNPRQNLGPVFEAGVGSWLTGHIGLDLSTFAAFGVVAGGQVTAAGPPALLIGQTTSAYVVSIAARIVARSGTSRARWTLFVLAGPALLMHGGDAYEGATGTSDLGGNIGVGARVRVAGTALCVELDDYRYSFQPEPTAAFGPPYDAARVQNDIVLSVGFPITLVGQSGSPR